MNKQKRPNSIADHQDVATIIARARRERDTHLRNMIGSLFGR